VNAYSPKFGGGPMLGDGSSTTIGRGLKAALDDAPQGRIPIFEGAVADLARVKIASWRMVVCGPGQALG